MSKTRKAESKSKNKWKTAIAIILIVLLSLLTVLVFLPTAVTYLGYDSMVKYSKSFQKVSYTTQLTPTKDSDGKWQFVTDNDFNVMQLTDLHIGGGCLSRKKDKMALNAVASMVTAEKPDLVVLTGDQVFPFPFANGSINNLLGYRLIANLFETLGVYWTFVYGNHDAEPYNYYDRQDIADYFMKGDYKYCLFDSGENEVDGIGNTYINIKNSDNLITQSLIMLDSHAYSGNPWFGVVSWKYDNIKQSQVDWYADTVSKLNQYNANVLDDLNATQPVRDKFTNVKSLLFFHIPLDEHREAFLEYRDNGYKDTENVEFLYGRMGEDETGKMIYSGEGEDNLFEKVLELNSTQGIFFGHDHYNGFSLKYKGVTMTYGMAIDYLAYSGISKVGSQRGNIMISIKNDTTFTHLANNYYQDKYPSKYPKEKVEMQFN